MAAVELSQEELAIIEKRRDRIKAKQRKVSKLKQLRDSLITCSASLSNYADDNDRETLAEAKRVLALTNPKKRVRKAKKDVVGDIPDTSKHAAAWVGVTEE